MDTITFLYSLIGTPLGYILYFIYNFICSNVGVAIILFTFIIKLAMLPLAIKQQKNTAKSAIFQPKVREIQTKYKNNQQKQQEELAKLQQQGYNPMGGCGSMILTFLILFGVLDVVYKPMTHIVHVNSDKISEIIEESYNVELTAVFVNEINKTDAELSELKAEDLTRHEEIVRDAQKILDYYNANLLNDGEEAKDISALSELTTDSKDLVKSVVKSAIAKEYVSSDGKFTMFTETDMYKLTDDEKSEWNALPDDEKAAYKAEHCFGDATMSAMNTVQSHYGYYKATDKDTIPFTANSSLQRELYALECFGTVKNGVAYRDAYSESVIRSELREELIELYDNLNFLGIPLGQVPWDHLGFPLILVPIISFLMALAQTVISNRMMAKNNPDTASTMGAMKITFYIMPLFSLWLAFTIPAGAGFYWTISYVFGIIQTIVLNKLYSPEKLRAEAEKEYNERMKQVNVSATKVTDADNNSTEDYNGEKLTQKEINRRKLAEARRQDAIKYGEEYHDDDDND